MPINLAGFRMIPENLLVAFFPDITDSYVNLFLISVCVRHILAHQNSLEMNQWRWFDDINFRWSVTCCQWRDYNDSHRVMTTGLTRWLAFRNAFIKRTGSTSIVTGKLIRTISKQIWRHNKSSNLGRAKLSEIRIALTCSVIFAKLTLVDQVTIFLRCYWMSRRRGYEIQKWKFIKFLCYSILRLITIIFTIWYF